MCKGRLLVCVLFSWPGQQHPSFLPLANKHEFVAGRIRSWYVTVPQPCWHDGMAADRFNMSNFGQLAQHAAHPTCPHPPNYRTFAGSPTLGKTEVQHEGLTVGR